eukprot:scaffold12931_cov102-Skeletonema_menzelii.AAC.1
MEGNDAGVYANQIETGTGSTKKRKKTWCYLYAFGFDWSNGHDRKKPDALDIKDMRSGPSPNARHMRESKIESEEYLGPHDHDLKLRVGDVQKMQFEDKNHLGQEQRGPLLWSEEQRQTGSV